MKFRVFVYVDVIEGSNLSQKALLEYDEKVYFQTYDDAMQFVKQIVMDSTYKTSDFKILADIETMEEGKTL